MSECIRDVLFYDSDSFRANKTKVHLEKICKPRISGSLVSLESEIDKKRPDILYFTYSDRETINNEKIKTLIQKEEYANLSIVLDVDVSKQYIVEELFQNRRVKTISQSSEIEDKMAVLKSVIKEMDKQPNVLILDQDEETRKEEILGLEDKFNPVEMKTGEEMLEYLKNNIPDVILVDIDVEDIDAMTLFEKVLENEKTKNIPFVLLTDFPDKTTTNKFIEKGIATYIVKPINQYEYNTKLIEAINGRCASLVKKTILVVDDDIIVLKNITDLLKNDFKVVAVSSANEAQKYLESKIPDLVLLDYEMPEKNGLFVLRNIRSHIQFNNTPVIMLTGNSDKQTVVSCIQNGAQGYLIKPINSMSLTLRVKQMLGSVNG